MPWTATPKAVRFLLRVGVHVPRAPRGRQSGRSERTRVGEGLQWKPRKSPRLLTPTLEWLEAWQPQGCPLARVSVWPFNVSYRYHRSKILHRLRFLIQIRDQRVASASTSVREGNRITKRQTLTNPKAAVQARSKRSAFITLFQVATKSRANFSFASACA
jgi:hypothetical protein